MKNDKLYLTHIKESIGKIQICASEGYEAFVADFKIQDAMIRNFEIIGEATKQVSEQTKERRDDIPWSKIAGLRDVLIHDYMGVDLDEVWNIVQLQLPALSDAVDEILSQF